MYETLEFYDSNGCDLEEVLKSCIYRYFITIKNFSFNSEEVFKRDAKNSIIKPTNKVRVLPRERS